MSNNYDIAKKNKVRQLADKADYDRATIHSILDSALVAQVGFVQDGAAVVVPMIYGRVGETVYLHGARKARIIRMLEENAEICINITLVDGLVLARSAFNSSLRYRSATVFGKPRLIESAQDKVEAMRIISEHSMPGRWAELREPFEREVKMTGVVAIDIQHASAKVASGMPDDEAEDYEIAVWAGVLPLDSRFGELLDDDRLLPGATPSDAVRALQHRQV